MKVLVKTYAGLKDYFQESMELELNGLDIHAVKQELGKIKPESLALLENCRFAINQEFAACEHELTHGDIIDILPPSSGG